MKLPGGRGKLSPIETARQTYIEDQEINFRHRLEQFERRRGIRCFKVVAAHIPQNFACQHADRRFVIDKEHRLSGLTATFVALLDILRPLRRRNGGEGKA